MVSAYVLSALVLLLCTGGGGGGGWLAYAQNADAEFPDTASGRIFQQKPDRIVTNALPGEAAGHARMIMEFFEKFTAQVRKDYRGAQEGGQTGEVDSETCNMQDSDWPQRANKYTEVHGLNSTSDECATAREIKNTKDLQYPDLRDILPKWGRALNNSAERVGQLSGKPFDEPAGVARFWYPDRENSNCTLWHTMAIRHNKRWYLQARITADNATEGGAARGARSDNDYLIEHVTVVNGQFADPLVMSLPLVPNVTRYDQRERFGSSSTSFEVDARPAPDSVGVNADISRNIAFRAALEDGDNEHQQAQDAEQVSNTAILLLPLAMNLVPVALIADVNTFGMLLYTALTDVLTTVPLCIKGVELIQISKKRFKAVSAQVTGNVEDPNANLVAEAWYAQCRLKKHADHMTRGVVFVVLSISLMCFGVACEFFAKQWVKRRKSTQIPVAPDSYPEAYGNSTSYQPFTAAALTLQQRIARVANRDSSGQPTAQSQGRSATAAAGMGVLPQHASSMQSGVRPSPNINLAADNYAVPINHNHTHRQNDSGCVCACHSEQHQRPEYHARAHPDPLGRKYR